MIFALLAFGTIWFWAALVIPFLALIYFVENEKSGMALTLIIATVAAFVAFGDPAVLSVFKDPARLALYAGGYLVAGVVWGLAKWFFHVLRARDSYEKFRGKFLAEADKFREQIRTQEVYQTRGSKNRGDEAERAAVKAAIAAPIPEGFDKELFRLYASRNNQDLRNFPPKASENKGRIVFWMVYWPASAFWTLLNDPLTWLYNFPYRRLVSLFEGISVSMFGKYKDELG